MFDARRPALALLLAGGSSLLLLSCGGGSPSTSTPPSTVSPSPDPTPGSGSGGDVGASSCPLGPGSPAAVCGEARRGSSVLAEDVQGAIDLLVTQKPGIFDTTDQAGTGQYRVLDSEAYLDGVVANLRSAGLCAQRDPDDYNYERIEVKSSNELSETYDVLLASGHVRRGETHRETCTPASFPVDRGDAPPAGSGCGAPYPPPITRFNASVHVPGGTYDLLDSTALVGPDARYCAEIGFTDGRSWCPVRMEGSPERVACEAWSVGLARDTGRPGPTWTRDGHSCTGPASGCENHPHNQHQVLAYAAGTYEMCAENGVCGTLVVQR